MFKKIKELAKVKSEESNLSFDNKEAQIDEESRKRTYHETGHRDSTRNLGNRITLKVSLNAIYAKFQNEEKLNIVNQQKLNEPYLIEKSENETLLKTTQVYLDNQNEKKNDKLNLIQNFKNEIASIQSNPNEYFNEAGKGGKVKFWIGIFIIVPITLYLLTFYISTSYSAFFKSFEIGDGVIESILDANALSKAWGDGPLEGMFVTFIPFVFMGLGYLIHMFGEEKKLLNYFKIFALIFVTFIFDAILAYQIESKLFKLEATLGQTFSISDALQSVSFWGIIFAGFLVYIIWGLVFDFVMKEHKSLDLITQAINEKLKRIKLENENLQEIQKNLDTAKEQIEKIKGRIDELNRLINAIKIPVKEYQLYASEYMQGWITSISENLYGTIERREQLIQNCYEEYQNHIEEVGSNKDYQHIIFRN